MDPAEGDDIHMISRALNNSKGLRAGAAFLATAFVLSACGGAEEAAPAPAPAPAPPTESGEPAPVEVDAYGMPMDIVEAALAEGRVNLYTSQGTSVAQDTADAFMAAYPGISVEILRLSTGPLQARIGQEQEAGIVEGDWTTLAAGALFRDHPEWFLELDEELVPNLPVIPEVHRGERFVRTVFGIHLVTVNSDAISAADIPSRWEDLIDPKFKGRFMLLDPRSSPTYLSWAYYMRQLKGDDFITALMANEPVLVDSGVGGSQQVAAGAYDFVGPNVGAHSRGLISDGAPIVTNIIGDPFHGFAHHSALFVNSPNPNAARVWLNWLLTAEAQSVNCEGVYGTSHPTAEGCLVVPEGLIIAKDDISFAEGTALLKLMGLS